MISCSNFFKRQFGFINYVNKVSRSLFNSNSTTSNQNRILVALGGNAIKKPNDKGTDSEMFNNINSASLHMMNLVRNHNYQLAITHGNGPQIGSIYLQNQLSNNITPAMPLSICGSMSQGFIGYMLQQSLQNNISKYNQQNTNTNNSQIKGVVTCITQVVVDINDSAWLNPSKPVGKFYTELEANELSNKYGYYVMEDSGRGWRVVVSSPKPIKIIESNAIYDLINNGYIVIACGGGGIPVVFENNNLSGKDAVIDKDLTAVRMGIDLNCDILMIATDIDGVYLDYLDENKRIKIDMMDIDQAMKYYNDGQFGKGSMGPKILAAIEFVKNTGNECIIGALDDIEQCVVGNKGTKIVKSDTLLK